MEKEDLKTDLEALAGGFFLTFGIIILIFFLLNYLNIFSLSSIYPKTLGFLPHREFASSQKKIAQTINLNVPIACPVAKEECQKAKIAEFKIPNTNVSRYEGIGFPGTAGEAVKAVFDGSYTIVQASMGKSYQRMLFLTRVDGKYEATYTTVSNQAMTGAESQKYGLAQKVTRGNSLFNLSGITFKDFNGPDISLKLSIQNKQEKAKIINLQPQDLDNLILP